AGSCKSRIWSAGSAPAGSPRWGRSRAPIAARPPASCPPAVPPAAVTIRVWSWALAPYASHHARWNAHDENGVADGLRTASRSHVVRSIASNGHCRTRRVPTAAAASALRSRVRASAEPGQAGSASGAWVVTIRGYHRPPKTIADATERETDSDGLGLGRCLGPAVRTTVGAPAPVELARREHDRDR